MIDIEEANEQKARIKVFGLGGAGGNALDNMIQQNLGGVMFYAANTDAQALNSNLAPIKLQLGNRLTGGLGAGGKPEVGREAAMEDQTALAEHVEDSDMVFITAGMGGGTGTGSAPVLASMARQAGALTVAIVTKPFAFEGRKRRRNAEEGLEILSDCVDTLIVIPNDRLLNIADADMTMVEAFRVADHVLYDAVKSISDIIVTPGLVNVDFADVRSIMIDQGRALMGTGHASGETRAAQAARMAVSSPLLEDTDIEGATGILLNITGGPDMKLREVNEAATFVEDAAHEDANIIFGAVIDESLKDTIKITVVATGFDRAARAGQAIGSRARASADIEREEVLRLLDADDDEEPVREVVTETARPIAVDVSRQPTRRDASTERPSRTRRSPRIFNPFSEPTRSEYDTPTFTRRRDPQSPIPPAPVVHTLVPGMGRDDESRS